MADAFAASLKDYQFSFTDMNKIVCVAFSYSKMTIENESVDYTNYDRMDIVEFYEFIGRWAYLTFNESGAEFIDQYKLMLKVLIPLVGRKFYMKKQRPTISYMSDYDEEVVDDSVKDCFQRMQEEKEAY